MLFEFKLIVITLEEFEHEIPVKMGSTFYDLNLRKYIGEQN